MIRSLWYKETLATWSNSKDLYTQTSNHNLPMLVKEVSYLAGITINTLPLFQYSLDCTHPNRTKVEKNRVVQINIIKLDNWRTWISCTTSLGRKMAHYKDYLHPLTYVTGNAVKNIRMGFLLLLASQNIRLQFLFLPFCYPNFYAWNMTMQSIHMNYMKSRVVKSSLCFLDLCYAGLHTCLLYFLDFYAIKS